jgi:hypothetical protein
LLGPYPFISLPLLPLFLPFISVVFPLAFLQVFNSDVSWLSSFLFQLLNLVSILPFPSYVVGAHKVHDLANPSSTFIVGVGPFLSKTSPIFVIGPHSWVKAMAI